MIGVVAVVLALAWNGCSNKGGVEGSSFVTTTTAASTTTLPEMPASVHGGVTTTCGGHSEVTVRPGDTLLPIVVSNVNLTPSSDEQQNANRQVDVVVDMIGRYNELNLRPGPLHDWQIYPGQKLNLPKFCSSSVND